MYEWLLFQYTSNGYSIEDVCRVAADEIEALRAEVEQWKEGEVR